MKKNSSRARSMKVMARVRITKDSCRKHYFALPAPYPPTPANSFFSFSISMTAGNENVADGVLAGALGFFSFEMTESFLIALVIGVTGVIVRAGVDYLLAVYVLKNPKSLKTYERIAALRARRIARKAAKNQKRKHPADYQDD